MFWAWTAIAQSDEYLKGNGAGNKSRTRDLMITNQLLYQLSYTGKVWILQY
jgi:hypothetical protein